MQPNRTYSHASNPDTHLHKIPVIREIYDENMNLGLLFMWEVQGNGFRGQLLLDEVLANIAKCGYIDTDQRLRRLVKVLLFRKLFSIIIILVS